MNSIKNIRARLKSSSITKADVIVGVAALAFLGESFLAGALIKSRRVAAVVFCGGAAISGAFVYKIYENAGTDFIDSLGGNFLFGSMVAGTAAAIAISYLVRFVAGFLAGMAWRAPWKSTGSATLALLAATVYFAGTAPLKDAQHYLTDAQGRTEAKLQFYGETTKALVELRKSNPDVDFKPLSDVLMEQVRSVTFTEKAE